MKISDLKEGRGGSLYHGFREEEHIIQAIHQNKLHGYASQRFWDDGKRYFDDEPEYKTSYWMKGISFTRDINYAKGWGNVVGIFDQRLLAQKYKFIPFNWGGTMRTQKFIKREREEFLILDLKKDRYLIDDEEDRFHRQIY